MKLDKNFFQRNAKKVAKELLGKILFRKLRNKVMRSKIVETEAYFDDKDPASRACKGGDLKDTMEQDAGTILIYGVHNNWLVNFVTGKKGKAEAVLLRALEPLNFEERCCGPGLLTKAIKIGKDLHRKNICDCEEFWIEDNSKKLNIVRKHRIGVNKDLKEPLRFYIKDNKHISRK